MGRHVMKNVPVVLFGLGNVNLGLLRILVEKKELLARTYGTSFVVTGVADSSGVAVNPTGYSWDELLLLKAGKGKVSRLEGFLEGVPHDQLPFHTDAGLLIESSPVNLETGDPGLAVARHALKKGWNVVFANKAPLVLAFDELHHLAAANSCCIAYSATVCGGLPVINVLQRDMKAASLKSFHGILNATTNHILKALEAGGTMEEAIKEAQRVGAAEADPMHDVLGHDAANKLYIIMKSFSGFTGTIHDIDAEGIQHITAEQLAEARKRGNTIRLIASATPEGNSWKLSVRPTEVKSDSFLGQCEGWEMGIQFESDLYESISMKIVEEDPMATSAAVLRDAIDIIN
jgi:homoserine dehydrogenase